jgi:hypothetical protein
VVQVTLNLPAEVEEALRIRFGSYAFNPQTWEDHILFFLQRNNLAFLNETRETVKELEGIEGLIKDGSLEEAKERLAQIVRNRGFFPWLVELQTRIEAVEFWVEEGQ